MTVKTISVLLLFVLAGVVVYGGLQAVYQTEYANGWDGYYYLVQVQSLNNTGVMHSPEYSLVYLPLLALHAVTNDYLVSYKLTAVLIKLLFVFSVFALALSLLRSARHTGNRGIYFTALLTAALSVMSPSLNYFFTQFPKNLLGFAFFFFFMASVFSADRMLKGGKRRGGLYLRIPGVLLLFLAAFFTHRFSAVLSVCFLVLYSVPPAKRQLSKWLTGERRKQGRLFLLIAILLLFFVLLLLISSRLPLAPSVHDLERITGDLSLKPIFIPASFIHSFSALNISFPWLVEIMLAGVLPFLTIVLFFQKKRFGFLRFARGYCILMILSLFGIFPFLKFSLTGISYRLFFGTLLMLPLIFLPYLHLAVDRMLILHRDTSFLRAGVFPVFIFLALLASSLYTGRSYNPELHDPPYGFYEEIAGKAVDALSDVEFELIIAHRSLAEMITFKYEVDALPWAPEEYFPRDRVWRITAGILRDEISYYLSPELADRYFLRLCGDYGLLREDQWEAFLVSIADDRVMMDAVDTWRNPLDRRPVYLIKNR